MSNKERIIELLDVIPDYKIGYVLAYVQGVAADEETKDVFDRREEEIEPDEWDLQMIEEAKRENDGETIALEDLAGELGVVL